MDTLRNRRRFVRWWKMHNADNHPTHLHAEWHIHRHAQTIGWQVRRLVPRIYFWDCNNHRPLIYSPCNSLPAFATRSASAGGFERVGVFNNWIDRVSRMHYNIRMNQASAIFKKLVTLEREVQKMKVRAYFNLPKQERAVSLSPENAIRRAVEASRNQIWQRTYAKKIKGVS